MKYTFLVLPFKAEVGKKQKWRKTVVLNAGQALSLQSCSTKQHGLAMHTRAEEFCFCLKITLTVYTDLYFPTKIKEN